jgi:hypothetical protein
MKKLVMIVFVVTLMGVIGYEWHGIATIIQPVTRLRNENHTPDFVRKSLEYLGCPGSRILPIANAIKVSTDQTGIGGVLIACLLYTESGFRPTAVSPKGYAGLGQTPTATMIYPNVDVLHSAMILKDKMRIADGNMLKAISLYKGGDNPVARKQARAVLQVYNQVSKQIGMV